MSQHFIMSSLVVLLLTAIFASSGAVPSEVVVNDAVNVAVHSTVDLRSQLVHQKNVIALKNLGPADLNSYFFALNEPELRVVVFNNEHGRKLPFKKIEWDSNSSFYEVALDEDVKQNAKYKLSCMITYANKITPAVKKRTFDEDQLVKFVGNVRFFSPYRTIFHHVEYLLHDPLLEVSKNATHLESTKITYIFYDTHTYAVDRVVIVLVKNDAFVVVKNIQRSIDVSHYGKIHVQDEVVIENNGVRLVGPFTGGKRKATTGWFYTHLPACTENIKFFDILGNNSKTQVYHFIDYITLKFNTRYPLMGGWKSSYVLSYDVPVHEYVLMDEEHYSLQMRALDYVLTDVVIESAVVKIRFPEGAQIKRVILPNSLTLENEGDGSNPSEQIIVLKGVNLFENYISNVTVNYSFNPLYMLRVPLVISVLFEGAFLVVLVGKYFVL